MASPTRLGSDNRPTFDFYSGFLTVVYGLLVSNGLEEAVKFGGDNPADQLESVCGLQFIGTFILALHFWFAFATLGETSDENRRDRLGQGGDNPALSIEFFCELLRPVFLCCSKFVHGPSLHTHEWLRFAHRLHLFEEFYATLRSATRGEVSKTKRGSELPSPFQSEMSRYKSQVWLQTSADTFNVPATFWALQYMETPKSLGARWRRRTIGWWLDVVRHKRAQISCKNCPAW